MFIHGLSEPALGTGSHAHRCKAHGPDLPLTGEVKNVTIPIVQILDVLPRGTPNVKIQLSTVAKMRLSRGGQTLTMERE